MGSSSITFPEYVSIWRESRERWLSGFFSWSDDEPTAEELDVARESYDSGAIWMRKQFKKKGMTISDEDLG